MISLRSLETTMGGTSFDGAVYDILGLCPTLLASNAHGNVPKFVEVIKLNDNDIKRLGNYFVEPAKIKIRQATKDGFIDCEIGGVADLNYPTSQTRRGRVQEDGNISPTLTTENIPSVIELADPEFYSFLYMIDGSVYLIRIRKLIPKECWRLMGISDEDFEKANKVNSSSQLYKQAGNAIVVNVLEAMYKNLFMREERQHD